MKFVAYLFLIWVQKGKILIRPNILLFINHSNKILFDTKANYFSYSSSAFTSLHIWGVSAEWIIQS